MLMFWYESSVRVTIILAQAFVSAEGFKVFVNNFLRQDKCKLFSLCSLNKSSRQAGWSE